MKKSGENELKKGVVLAYITLLVNNLSAFLYTPFMLRTMGRSEYGLYSLCFSMVNYLTVLDFGLGNAVIRYVAKYRKNGTDEERNQINGLFLLVYSAIGILATIIGILIYLNIDLFFSNSLTLEEIHKAKLIVIILLINVVLTFPLSVFSSILTAYEKFVFTRSLNIIRTLLLPIIMIPLLLLGYKSIAMSIVVTILNITVLLISCIYCVITLKVKFKFRNNNFKIIKEIVSYSFFAFLLLIVDKINWNVDQVILGRIASTVEVAVYSVASQISFIYLAFPSAISGVMLPKLTILSQEEGNEKLLSDTFLKISRVQLYIALFVFFGFVLIGKEFFQIWAGSEYEMSYYIATILMGAAAIPLSLNIGNVILQAKNKQKFRSIILIIISITNIIVSIPLAKRYGAIGCTIGTAISYIFGHLLIMSIYFKRSLNLNMLMFWSNTIKTVLCSILALAISYVLNIFIREVSILNLIIKGSSYSLIFFIVIYFLCANEEEKEVIKIYITKIKRVMKRKEIVND